MVRIRLPPAKSWTNVDTGEVPFRGQVISESLPIPMIAPAEGATCAAHTITRHRPVGRWPSVAADPTQRPRQGHRLSRANITAGLAHRDQEFGKRKFDPREVPWRC